MPSEPGPNFSTFGGAGAGGGFVGTNQLQVIVDKFAQAVDKLAGLTGSQATGGGGAGFPRPVNPFSAAPGASAGSSTSFPRPSNPFVNPMSAGASPQQAQNLGGTTQAAWVAPLSDLLAMPAPAWIDSLSKLLQQPAPAAQASGTQATGGTQPSGSQPNAPGLLAAQAFPSANGGMGATTGSGGGGLPGINTGPGTGAGGNAVLGAAGAATNIVTNIGSSTRQSQLALNTLQYQNALGGVSYGTTARNALGSVGGTSNPYGFNAGDELSAQTVLQQAAANPNVGFGNQAAMTPGARNVVGGFAMASAANPQMSATQNASVIAQLTNPATSVNMMMQGYPTTAVKGRQAGAQMGQANPIGSVLAPAVSAVSGRGTMNMQALAGNLMPGQAGNVTLQNLFPGMSQDQLSQVSSMIQMEYSLGTGQKVGGAKGAAPKLNLSQINQLMGTQGLGSGNAATRNKAEQQLSQYGFKQSDYDKIKQAAVPGEQAISTTSQAYTSGLQDNTAMMKTLNATLQQLLKMTGLEGPVGFAEGFLGMFKGGSNAHGGGSNIIGGGAGISPKIGTSPHTAAHMRASAKKTTAHPSSMATKAVGLAKTQEGVPYVYGKEAPGKGFDCSALPQWAYAHAGINLPRTAAQQYEYLKKSLIDPKTAIEGDLVFSSGPGASMHEALVTDNGRHIIEAKSVGTKIHIGTYDPAQWKYAARPGTRGAGTATKASKTNVVGGGATSGAQVASYAAKFATGQGHPYVWGGNSPTTGWDCSGFADYVYGHFGYNIPRTTQAMWGDTAQLQKTSATPGALVLEAGSGGSVGSPGHVGIYVSSGKMVAAADRAEGTIMESPSGVSGYMIPKKGFAGGTGAGAGSVGTMTGTGAGAGTATSASTGAATSSIAMPGAGTGDTTSEGSSEEVDVFGGGLGGGLGSVNTPGGAGSGAATATTTAAITPGGPTSASGGATSKGALSAAAISKLWTSLGGPASAAANMARIAMAESGDNPGITQKGQPGATTGYGLYQITPTSGISQNGQFGNLLNASNNTKAAIYLYQKDGYRPWAADAVGASLAATGGPVPAGQKTWVGERGPELVSFSKDAHINTASDSARLMKSAMTGTGEGPWSAGPGASLNVSQMHPSYGAASSASRGGSGVSINFAAGSIVLGGGNSSGGATGGGSPTVAPAGTSAAGMTATGYGGAAQAQAFAKQLRIELARLNLTAAAGTGVTS